jgi:anaerobic ribonucleoside-triphosphate reductase activating protein
VNRPAQLRIHHIEPFSRANGPGWRTVIWFQGCTLGCPGCFNPETHLPAGGSLTSIAEILARLQAAQPEIEGVTISGGEPLQQKDALIELLTQIKQSTNLSVVLFSGYTFGEIQKMPKSRQFLPMVDILLAGRYDPSRRLASGLIGSANKTVHFFSSRYTIADLSNVPEAEVIIKDNGEIILSGINPIQLS